MGKQPNVGLAMNTDEGRLHLQTRRLACAGDIPFHPVYFSLVVRCWLLLHAREHKGTAEEVSVLGTGNWKNLFTTDGHG